MTIHHGCNWTTAELSSNLVQCQMSCSPNDLLQLPVEVLGRDVRHQPWLPGQSDCPEVGRAIERSVATLAAYQKSVMCSLWPFLLVRLAEGANPKKSSGRKTLCDVENGNMSTSRKMLFYIMLKSAISFNFMGPMQCSILLAILTTFRQKA
jgi:hypothetical protein